jgi:hypothetical protein
MDTILRKYTQVNEKNVFEHMQKGFQWWELLTRDELAELVPRRSPLTDGPKLAFLT